MLAFETALAEAGAHPGDDVELGGAVFVFQPEDWAGDGDDWDDWDGNDDRGQDWEVDETPIEIDLADEPDDDPYEDDEDDKDDEGDG